MKREYLPPRRWQETCSEYFWLRDAATGEGAGSARRVGGVGVTPYASARPRLEVARADCSPDSSWEGLECSVGSSFREDRSYV